MEDGELFFDKLLAKAKGIEIRYYSIIYNIIDDVKDILKNFYVIRFWNSLPRNFLEYKFYKYLMVIKYD